MSRRWALGAGLAIVTLWLAAALTWPYFAPYDPFTDDILAVLEAPSSRHWFGTDLLGRDVFSRVVAGSSEILLAAPAAAVLGVLIGSVLGLLMGYYGGVADTLLGRLLDALRAVPLVLLALLALVALGPSMLNVVIVIGLAFAPIVAQAVRVAVQTERRLEYVDAARLRGESSLHIMFAEILPNVRGPILVETTLRFGFAIFAIAGLSFLGFGLQPPSPNWGATIAENYPLIGAGYWWVVAFDALAIASLVIGVHLVAENLAGEPR
ncbi:ABC transporter permease [Steroidobacter cummioxidans]|uniref:ABC transporter permease n=1 Tax=Steroidobacter cummioxidans TaxID=1803913 RepID=UPI000E31C892|nr:ABC transporter permease [Steroidobacter cummioxidans]